LLFSFPDRGNVSTFQKTFFFGNQNFSYRVSYTVHSTEHNAWHDMIPHYSKSIRCSCLVHFKPSSHLEIFVHSVHWHLSILSITFGEDFRCWCWNQVLCNQWKHTVGIRTFCLFPKFFSCTFRGRAEIDEVLANGRSDCKASISWCRPETSLDSVCPNLPA